MPPMDKFPGIVHFATFSACLILRNGEGVCYNAFRSGERRPSAMKGGPDMVALVMAVTTLINIIIIPLIAGVFFWIF